ncbi:hypothetical protein KR038_002565, partial [Drosophila bunnanda]
QLMPITTMSSASLKFYLISLILICALSWSTGMPGNGRPNCQLSYKERERIYQQAPAVTNERWADAELDSAYDPCKYRRP